MGFKAKETPTHVTHSVAFEYEDHPFQPSRIFASSETETKKEEQRPLATCSQLKTRPHGKQRMFERDEPRRTGGQGRALPI